MKNIKTQKNKTATFQLRCFASVIEGGGGGVELQKLEKGKGEDWGEEEETRRGEGMERDRGKEKEIGK